MCLQIIGAKHFLQPERLETCFSFMKYYSYIYLLCFVSVKKKKKNKQKKTKQNKNKKQKQKQKKTLCYSWFKINCKYLSSIVSFEFL